MALVISMPFLHAFLLNVPVYCVLFTDIFVETFREIRDSGREIYLQYS